MSLQVDCHLADDTRTIQPRSVLGRRKLPLCGNLQLQLWTVFKRGGQFADALCVYLYIDIYVAVCRMCLYVYTCIYIYIAYRYYT